jgi:hypothetical protein
MAIAHVSRIGSDTALLMWLTYLWLSTAQQHGSCGSIDFGCAQNNRSMLGYMETPAVTRNAAEKKVNSLLDFMGAGAQDVHVLQARWMVGQGKAVRVGRAGLLCGT